MYREVPVEKRVVEVTLQGQRFVLKSDLDEATLNNIVAFANQRIDAVAGVAPNLPSHRIALLALLGMAEDLFSERRHLTDLRESIRSKSNLLLGMLDESSGRVAAVRGSGDNPPGEG